MPLSDFTGNERLVEIAQFHSRMVEIAIVRGNSDMAHRAVDRAFEILTSNEKVDQDTPLDDLIGPQMARSLAKVNISTVGQLCEHSRGSLVLLRGIRHRFIDKLEEILAVHGLRIAKGFGDGQ